jgi:transposase
MTEEEAVMLLEQALRDKKAADKAAREAFEEKVVEALRGGMKAAQVAAILGVHYETIRLIARAHNVERLREPTVTSRKKAEGSA